VRKHRKKAGLLAAVAAVGTMLGALSPGFASATTVPTGYDTATSTGTIGPAAPGDAITVPQILERGQDWINDAVPYSEYAGWEDAATGGPYRTDCSGFVSMAWGLQKSQTTETLPSVSNVVIGNNGNTGNIQNQTNLQAGDALDYTSTHVVLFTAWTNLSSGYFAYDAEHTTDVPPNQTVAQATVYGSSLEGYPITDFEDLRYDNLTPTTAFTAWMGGPNSGNDLWSASGPANGSLAGLQNVSGTGPLNSAPALAVDPSNGYVYAYWEGGPDSGNALWEAYWDGSSWHGPYDRDMGPLNSQPTVAISGDGTAYVFWEGGPDSGNDLWEAYGSPSGPLNGPYNISGTGPLNSAPAAAIDGSGNIAVYWEGGPDSGNALWEEYGTASSANDPSPSSVSWSGPYDRQMGPLNSAPTVAMSPGGTAYVFWQGGPDSGNALFQAQGPASGSLSGPYNRHMGPLGSAPSAGIGANGYTYVYWEGGPNSGNALFEGYWNGSSWVGPYNRGMGPLDSQPAVAVAG
jgi:hypothetical protein